ncbi:AAEL004080-PA [Aedes aegypti]|uniref:AAEL004080-PA n=1 Tax=Aedes aegypti TaxID=7159 RepID=Q17DS6_AEDAE|nr:AAEL004080-PA [Aedes aegypti]
MSENGDTEDTIVCSICKKQELDSTRIIECSVCFNSMHFRCKRIFGTGITRARQQSSFVCSPNCAEIYGRMNGNPNFEKLVAELNESVRASIKQEMEVINAKIDTSQQSMMKELHSFANRFDELKIENDNLKKTVASLTEKYDSLMDSMITLETEVNRSSCSAMEKNAVILGLPMTENEDTKDVFQQLCSSLSFDLPENAVLSAKRMVSKNAKGGNPPIKIVFTDSSIKERFFATKKQHGQLLSTVVNGMPVNGKPGNVLVRDELSSLGLSMLREVRGMQDALGIKYVWPGRGGVILLKRNDGAKVEMIRNRQDIDRLGQKLNKRTLSDSSPRSLNNSAVNEPSSKRTCP